MGNDRVISYIYDAIEDVKDALLSRLSTRWDVEDITAESHDIDDSLQRALFCLEQAIKKIDNLKGQ